MFEERPFHLLQGDNFEHLQMLEDNSIDSCVTDPPYGLGNEPNPIELLTDWIEKGFHEVKNKRGFMGKEWDAFVPQPILWKEIFRVLKPGSHLLSFCGTRTYDLMALAIRLSGFEIRDNILVVQNGTPEYHYLSWIYGSGFPKSMNISKAIDKKPNALRVIEFKKWLKKQIELCPKSDKQINDECGFTATSYRKTDGNDHWTTNLPKNGKWEVMKRVIGITSTKYDWVAEDNTEERGFIESKSGLAGGTGNTVGCFTGKELSANAISPDAQKWSGYGTAIKPAHEHIIIARKPIEKGLTVAQNVLKYGTGAINIDGCRIGDEERTYKGMSKNQPKVGTFRDDNWTPKDIETTVEGRFPANVIYDGNEVEQEFDDLGTGQSSQRIGDRKGKEVQTFGAFTGQENVVMGHSDSGSVKRFFYTPKTSQLDRNEGLEFFDAKRNADRNKDDGVGGDNPRNRSNKAKQNFHPTVKPVELMRYLCRLVTPQDGICLDPYMGSGSTGKACLIERFKFIGMELEDDHFQLAEARLLHANFEPVRNIEVETDVSDLPLFQKR